MKKKSIDFLRLGRNLKKLLLIMRLSFILMLAAVFNVTASVYSQTVRVDLELKDATLEEVFQSIQEQTEFDFFYKNEHLPSNKIINLKFSNAKIDEVLDEVLDGTGLIYRVLNKDIVITKGEKSDSGSEELFAQQQTKNITGKVTDENGLPLPGVTVVAKGTTRGTVTDVEGVYNLPVPENTDVITFSFIGFKKQDIQLENRTSVYVQMVSDVIGLEEVVAIGYGVAKKIGFNWSNYAGENRRIEKVYSIKRERPSSYERSWFKCWILNYSKREQFI